MGRASRGCSRPTPVANAKADAEWPDGNEKLPGMLIGSGRSNRRRGGRSRRATYFSGRLTRVRSPGLMDLGSNLRTLAAILVSASAIDIGGAASFLRDGGTNRTGLMRATITARK